MKKKHSVDVLFPLVLYGMFMVVFLLLVLVGARIYKGTVQRADVRGDIRASLSYVANKARSSDSMSLENREGLDVLVLSEAQDGGEFETLIYFYDGVLRELFQKQGDAFEPDTGEKLVTISDFSVTEEDGFLKIMSMEQDGREHVLHIRQGRGRQ